MPDLVVRNIEEEVTERLKQQAKSHGVSPEEEHRSILRQALRLTEDHATASDFKEHLLSMAEVGEDSDFSRIAGSMREIDFTE